MIEKVRLSWKSISFMVSVLLNNNTLISCYNSYLLISKCNLGQAEVISKNSHVMLSYYSIKNHVPLFKNTQLIVCLQFFSKKKFQILISLRVNGWKQLDSTLRECNGKNYTQNLSLLLCLAFYLSSSLSKIYAWYFFGSYYDMSIVEHEQYDEETISLLKNKEFYRCIRDFDNFVIRQENTCLYK